MLELEKILKEFSDNSVPDYTPLVLNWKHLIFAPGIRVLEKCLKSCSCNNALRFNACLELMPTKTSLLASIKAKLMKILNDNPVQVTQTMAGLKGKLELRKANEAEAKGVRLVGRDSEGVL